MPCVLALPFHVDVPIVIFVVAASAAGALGSASNQDDPQGRAAHRSQDRILPRRRHRAPAVAARHSRHLRRVSPDRRLRPGGDDSFDFLFAVPPIFPAFFAINKNLL